ncbi:ROK family protein [Paenibacillus thermotolerans]|uniref:ROK family protein n=1 Tax=Paenibacillus thermotolerans TaxID=3027807 RepID=UPI002368C39E|nr:MULTISPECIES: ROK family protein [unclassified Paenibacillus]
MKITGDQSLIKKMNKGHVLDCIVSGAPLSRADISAKIGLNKASVSTLVNEWIEEQLVIETGLGQSSGGRKPVMLLFNNKGGYSVGVDLGVNYVAAVLTDLTGNVIKRVRLALEARDADSVYESLRQAIRSVSAAAPPSPYGIVGIGVGVPGIVDESGTILSAPNLGWRDVSLKEKLQSDFQTEVSVENEANAGAVGEQKYGIGTDVPNLVYISAGIGIGSGIIMHGGIYRGAFGYSGELGHMTIQADNGLLCSCGNTGCWEMYASENALLREAKDAIGHAATLESLMEAAECGNEIAIRRFETVGYYLGTGIANVMNGFNPEMVVVGNRLSLAGKWIKPALLQAVQRRSLRFHSKEVRIEFAALGTDSTALGSASLAVSGFLQRIKG